MLQADKTALLNTAQTNLDASQAVVDAINALSVDPDVNPLQEQLDQALAANATLTADLGKANDKIARIVQKMDALEAADEAEDAADAQEDQLRADIRNIAAE